MLQADEIAHAHGVHRIHINLGHESSRHARHAWLRQLCWCWFIQAARQPRKRRCELFSSQRLYGQCECDRVWILDRVVSRCAVRATTILSKWLSISKLCGINYDFFWNMLQLLHAHYISHPQVAIQTVKTLTSNRSALNSFTGNECNFRFDVCCCCCALYT